MITQFLSGKFDPAYKQTGYAMRRMRAAVSKPKTKKVVVECDWSEASEKRAIAKMRMLEKQKMAAKIAAEKTEVPVAGVRFNRRQARWVADITYKQVRYNLGTYLKREDAVMARRQAECRINNGERPQ